MLSTKTLLTGGAAVCLALAIASPSPASAKSVTYQGTVSGGSKISMQVNGTKVTRLIARVPVACVSTRTSDTKAGADWLNPPAVMRFGIEQTISAEQSSAFAASGVTKNYRWTLKKAKGKRGAISGKLHMNFMAVEPYFNAMGYLDGNTFVCQGDATFTARPR